MKVGYFTQYQVEELASDATPLEHMTRAMEGKTPGAVRAQLGRFGFSGPKATTQVAKLSGGERARLALALITRDAPHLLILDEPTNHLDVDAREALVQALNDYEGAVILISHDRHMVELTADRLVLVDGGTATEYAGSIEDYIDFVLGRNQPKDKRAGRSKKGGRTSSRERQEAREARDAVGQMEKRIAGLQDQIARIDRALIDGASTPELSAMAPADLARKRSALAKELSSAEAEWLDASENLEQQVA
jgi:ATP-binding cassette subfamily F protein 3